MSLNIQLLLTHVNMKVQSSLTFRRGLEPKTSYCINSQRGWIQRTVVKLHEKKLIQKRKHTVTEITFFEWVHYVPTQWIPVVWNHRNVNFSSKNEETCLFPSNTQFCFLISGETLGELRSVLCMDAALYFINGIQTTLNGCINFRWSQKTARPMLFCNWNRQKEENFLIFEAISLYKRNTHFWCGIPQTLILMTFLVSLPNFMERPR
jgi:hypothetical protein